MTELEQRAIRSLRAVKVPHNVWHGARVESLNMWLTLRPEASLPITDAADLWFLVWRYRRQIEDESVVAHADGIVNGALHLDF